MYRITAVYKEKTSGVDYPPNFRSIETYVWNPVSDSDKLWKAPFTIPTIFREPPLLTPTEHLSGPEIMQIMEVKQAVREMKNDKSKGGDGVVAEM